MNEALRQQRFLAALSGDGLQSLALREQGARAAHGLEAYRGNAEAIAERALAACFPTVRAMVGADDFMRLASGFHAVSPAARGDLGEWGEALPAWLAAHPRLTAWPWLSDGARLDLALHRAERAADPSFDAASLGLLESADPAGLRLSLAPGCAVLSSAWPVATIHRAHQLQGDAAERAFESVREAIARQRGEEVLVARRGWRAVVHPLDAATAAWTRDLLAAVPLGDALVRAGDGFDFAGWLAFALRESLLEAVVALHD